MSLTEENIQYISAHNITYILKVNSHKFVCFLKDGFFKYMIIMQ